MTIEQWAEEEKQFIDDFITMSKKDYPKIVELDDIEWDEQYTAYKELYQ